MKKKILLIEDNPEDKLLMEIYLKRTQIDFELFHVETVADALAMIAKHVFDIALMDISLPDNDDMDGISRVVAAAPDLPIIVTTGMKQKDLSDKIISCGAQDFINKWAINETIIERAINYGIERQNMLVCIKALSLIDELTKINNLRGFKTLSEHQLKISKRSKENTAVLFIDLDNMKKINDEFGHHTGNEALKEIAGIFEDTFRDSDIIGRVGGDEFVVFLSNVRDEECIDKILNKLYTNISLFNRDARKPYRLKVSAGHAYAAHDDAEQLESLIQVADTSMYKAKKLSKAKSKARSRRRRK